MSLNNQTFETIEITDTFKQWADKCNVLFETVNTIDIPLVQDVVGINNTQSIFGSKTFEAETILAGTTFVGLTNSVNILSGNLNIGDQINPTVTNTNFYAPNITFQKSQLDPSVGLTFKDGSATILSINDGGLEIPDGDLNVPNEITAGTVVSDLSRPFSIKLQDQSDPSNFNFQLTEIYYWRDENLKDDLRLYSNDWITFETGDVGSRTRRFQIDTNDAVGISWGDLGATEGEYNYLRYNGDLQINGDEINFFDSATPAFVFNQLGHSWVIPEVKPGADAILKWDINTDKLAWQDQGAFEDLIENQVAASLTSANFSLPVQLNPVGTVIAVDATILNDWNQADEGTGGITYIEDDRYDTWLVPDGIKKVSFDLTANPPEDKYEKICKLLNPTLTNSGEEFLPDYSNTDRPVGTIYLMKVAEDRVINFRISNVGGVSGNKGITLKDTGDSTVNYLDINGGSIELNIDSNDLYFSGSGQLSVKGYTDARSNAAYERLARYGGQGRLHTNPGGTDFDHAVAKQDLDGEINSLTTFVNSEISDVNDALTQTLLDVQTENQILLDRINEFENKGTIWKFPARDGNLTLGATGISSAGKPEDRLWGTAMNRGLTNNAIYIGTDRRAYIHSDDGGYDFSTYGRNRGSIAPALSPVTNTWAKFKEVVNLGHRHLLIDEDDIVYGFGNNFQDWGLGGYDAHANPVNNWMTTGTSISNINIDGKIPRPAMVPNATGRNSSDPCQYIRAHQISFFVYPSGDYWWKRNGCTIITKPGYDLDDVRSFTGDGSDNGINKPLHRGHVISGGHLDSANWYGLASSQNTHAHKTAGPNVWGPGQTQQGSVLWWQYGNSNETVSGNLNRVRQPGFKSFNWHTPESGSYSETNKWYIKKIVQSGFDQFVIVGHDDNEEDNELWAWGNNDWDQCGNIALRGQNASHMIPVLNHNNLSTVGGPIMNDGGNTRIFRRVDGGDHGLQDFDAIKMPNNYWYFVITGDGNNERKQNRFRVFDYSSENDLTNGLFPATPGTTNAASFTLPSTSTFVPQYYTRLTGIVDIKADFHQNSHNYSSIMALRKVGNYGSVTNPNYDLWTWGWNAHGQCGQGSISNKALPKKAAGYVDQVYAIGNSNIIRKNNAIFFAGWQKNSGGSGFYKTISSTNTTENIPTFTRCTIGDAGNNSVKKLFVSSWNGGTGHALFAVTRTTTQEQNGEEAHLYVNGYNYYQDIGWHMAGGNDAHDGAGTYTNGWRRIYFPEDPMNIVQVGTMRDHVTFILCKDGGDPSEEKGRVYYSGYTTDNNASNTGGTISPTFRSASKFLAHSYE